MASVFVPRSQAEIDDPVRLLDLCCGEGGAALGFARAGFEPFGVDSNDDWSSWRHRPRVKPLKRYPFSCLEADALDVLRRLLAGERVGGHLLADFAGVHASPPCQEFSTMTRVNDSRRPHVDLISPLRVLLRATGLPYIIENVEHAPLEGPVLLCGSMFDPPLDVRRHRLFETNWPLVSPNPCRHKLWTPRFPQRDYRRGRDYLMSVVPVYGGTRFAGDRALRRRVMGMPWATLDGINEAIPPAYSEWIGGRLAEHLGARMMAA